MEKVCQTRLRQYTRKGMRGKGSDPVATLPDQALWRNNFVRQQRGWPAPDQTSKIEQGSGVFKRGQAPSGIRVALQAEAPLAGKKQGSGGKAKAAQVAGHRPMTVAR